MPVTALSIGPPILLKLNQIYALPGVRCVLYVNTQGITLQSATNQEFTDPYSLVPIGGYVNADGGFIRSTLADSTVILRKRV